MSDPSPLHRPRRPRIAAALRTTGLAAWAAAVFGGFATFAVNAYPSFLTWSTRVSEAAGDKMEAALPDAAKEVGPVIESDPLTLPEQIPGPVVIGSSIVFASAVATRIVTHSRQREQQAIAAEKRADERELRAEAVLSRLVKQFVHLGHDGELLLSVLNDLPEPITDVLLYANVVVKSPDAGGNSTETKWRFSLRSDWIFGGSQAAAAINLKDGTAVKELPGNDGTFARITYMGPGAEPWAPDNPDGFEEGDGQLVTTLLSYRSAVGRRIEVEFSPGGHRATVLVDGARMELPGLAGEGLA